MKKYIGLIGAIALIVWLISRADLKLPQASPPSPKPLRDTLVGWQDVVIKEYGYRVKMPHDWSQLQLEGEPAYPQRLKLVNVKPEEQVKPHVSLVATVMPFKNQPLEAYPDIQALVADGREPRKLKMAGESALFFDKLGESGEELSVFIQNNNYIYRFDWSGTHPDVRKQYKDVGLKILASLQFL